MADQVVEVKCGNGHKRVVPPGQQPSFGIAVCTECYHPMPATAIRPRRPSDLDYENLEEAGR